MNDTELTALLIATDPDAVAPPDRDRLTGLSLAMAREVASAEPRRERRRFTTRRLAAVGVAALVAVPTGAWAADRFLAQTGEFGAPGMTENDTSEWIDLCATDLGTYVRSLPRPSGELPAGTTWDEVVDTVATDLLQTARTDCPSPGATMQETGVRSQFLFTAQGLWACSATKADDANDAAGVLAAGREVALVWDRLDALGVLGGTAADWAPFRERAASGDAAFLREFFADASGEC